MGKKKSKKKAAVPSNEAPSSKVRLSPADSWLAPPTHRYQNDDPPHSQVETSDVKEADADSDVPEPTPEPTPAAAKEEEKASAAVTATAEATSTASESKKNALEAPSSPKPATLPSTIEAPTPGETSSLSAGDDTIEAIDNSFACPNCHASFDGPDPLIRHWPECRGDAWMSVPAEFASAEPRTTNPTEESSTAVAVAQRVEGSGLQLALKQCSADVVKFFGAWATMQDSLVSRLVSSASPLEWWRQASEAQRAEAAEAIAKAKAKRDAAVGAAAAMLRKSGVGLNFADSLGYTFLMVRGVGWLGLLCLVALSPH